MVSALVRDNVLTQKANEKLPRLGISASLDKAVAIAVGCPNSRSKLFPSAERKVQCF